MCMPGKKEEPVEAEANLTVVSTASGTDSHISACTPLLGADTFSEACAENCSSTYSNFVHNDDNGDKARIAWLTKLFLEATSTITFPLLELLCWSPV